MIFRILFVLHFLCYLIIHSSFDSLGDVSRLIILFSYLFATLLVIQANKNFIVKSFDVFAIIGILIILIFNVVLVKHFNSQILYPVLLVIYLSVLPIKKDDINWMVRFVPIIYLFFNLLFIYSPFNFLTQYNVRNLEGRGLIGLDRMIGISGSPAGPDILFTLTLFYTIFLIDKKNLVDRINIFISIFVLLWTSSLSPLFACLIGFGVVMFPKTKKLIAGMSFIYWIVLVYIYRSVGDVWQAILKTLTSLRVRIWDDVWTELVKVNTQFNWVFGRDKMVEFVGLEEQVDANPHNSTLYFLQFFGFFGLLIVISFILIKISKIDNTSKITLFLIIMILYYLSMSPIPVTMNGDPFTFYFLILLLVKSYLFQKPQKITQ